MSKSSMSCLEVVAALLNGCHLVGVKRRACSGPKYKVMLPCGNAPDKFVGNVSIPTVELLSKYGFIDSNYTSRVADDGTLILCLKAGVPSMPFFSLTNEGDNHG